jgi:Spy/CpxP family protein refolding chaperone
MTRVLLLAILFVCTAATAQTPPAPVTPPVPQAPPVSPTPPIPPMPPPAPDELAQNLFAPDLVLKYRQDIALDDAQSKSLKELVTKAQSRFLDLQWDMQVEAGKLAQLLRASRIDENTAIAQADRVLGMEREVKKAQLSLLVRIKNLLTPAQQEKLAELRRKNP